MSHPSETDLIYQNISEGEETFEAERKSDSLGNESSERSLSQGLAVKVLRKLEPDCYNNLTDDEEDGSEALSDQMMDQIPLNGGEGAPPNAANDLHEILDNLLAEAEDERNENFEDQIERAFLIQQNKSLIERLPCSKLKLIIANSLWTDEKIDSISALGNSSNLRSLFENLGKSDELPKPFLYNGIVVHVKKLEFNDLTICLSEGIDPSPVISPNDQQSGELSDMIAQGDHA